MEDIWEGEQIFRPPNSEEAKNSEMLRKGHKGSLM